MKSLTANPNTSKSTPDPIPWLYCLHVGAVDPSLTLPTFTCKSSYTFDPALINEGDLYPADEIYAAQPALLNDFVFSLQT